jgi:hypothetical protein
MMASRPIFRTRIVVEKAVLSSKHGGKSGQRDRYCLYYKNRPMNLDGVLCSKCPDKDQCRANHD